MDIFPSFKGFYKPKTEQDAFTIDDRDIAEMKKSIPTNSIKKSKLNNPTLDMTKKSNSNSSIQCDICLVPISSEIVYNTHINGRKHQTILTALISVRSYTFFFFIYLFLQYLFLRKILNINH